MGRGVLRLDQARVASAALPLGKLHNWEVATWEKAFGKVHRYKYEF